MNGVKLSLGIFSGIALLFLSLPLCAQEHFTADTAGRGNWLNEVKIRQVKINKEQTSQTPLQILSGEALQRLNSLSVADAVRFFSGVQLKDYGGVGGLKTINVRSMGTNHTAVFYDGVQLSNAQNGQVDLGKLSLDNMEEIELYNGQKSTILQPARGFASGSSLYLNTALPKFEEGRTFRMKTSLKGGSFGLINPSLLLQKKAGENFYFTLSTEYKRANGRYKFRDRNGEYDTTIVRRNADIESGRFEASVSALLADSSQVTSRFYFYKDQQGVPGSIVSNVYDFSQRQWDRNLFLQTSFRKERGRYRLIASAKYTNDYTRFLDPEYVKDEGLLLNNVFKQQEFYISVANRYSLTSNWGVAFSADYQRNSLDANLERFPYPTRHSLLAALATEIKYSDIEIQGNLLATLVDDHVEQYFSAGKKSELTPTVMASWKPFHDSDFRLRAFYKNIFRMPTFNDLYYTNIGSPFLKPEYATQYDLGFTYIALLDEEALLSQISVQADGYYNVVRDKIVATPSASLFRWEMRNLGRVHISGFDLNTQTGWKFSDQISGNAGITYTYQRAEDVTNPELNYKNQIPYVPIHSGTLTAGCEWRHLGLNYSYIYTGERYNQSANIPANHVQPWYTHDIALRYERSKRYQRYRITGEILNLFNQDFDVVANFPMPGRSYRFTLSYTY